ncbi:MAG TPA: glucose 1-dehydrogenase [Hyphomicrobiaceae bacterium]|nr:glucose 1-dehydrogenase [Hyphomicrobiaceae bacterium]
MQLQGKIALITGAGQGIGRATALAYAAEGADLVLADLNAEALAEVQKAVEAKGRRAISIEADLGDVEAIDAMVTTAIKQFGRIDVLVNNAGVTRKAFMMDITEADWDRIHRVNAKGVFFCMQRVAREMIKQNSGRIINMASIAGKGYRDSSNVAYAGSKGAVIAMTRMASSQLGGNNINVNAICPGITRTALYNTLLETQAKNAGLSMDEMAKVAFDTIPLKLANEPEDIAAMAVFLAGPGGRTITGQSYNIDGGLIPD